VTFFCRAGTIPDQHAAPVGGILRAANVARLLEAVDDDGDAAGGEAAALGEEAGVIGPSSSSRLKKLHVGGVETEFLRHALAEKAGAGNEEADRADEGREETGMLFA